MRCALILKCRIANVRDAVSNVNLISVKRVWRAVDFIHPGNRTCPYPTALIFIYIISHRPAACNTEGLCGFIIEPIPYCIKGGVFSKDGIGGNFCSAYLLGVPANKGVGRLGITYLLRPIR